MFAHCTLGKHFLELPQFPKPFEAFSALDPVGQEPLFDSLVGTGLGKRCSADGVLVGIAVGSGRASEMELEEKKKYYVSCGHKTAMPGSGQWLHN